MAKEEKKKNSKAQEETVETTETETKAEEATEEKEPTAEEKLTEELKKEKEKYMRLAAEYDNYRKRTQQEKLGIYDDATAKAVTELLPVADSVRMALDNLANADPEIIKGIFASEIFLNGYIKITNSLF